MQASRTFRTAEKIETNEIMATLQKKNQINSTSRGSRGKWFYLYNGNTAANQYHPRFNATRSLCNETVLPPFRSTSYLTATSIARHFLQSKASYFFPICPITLKSLQCHPWMRLHLTSKFQLNISITALAIVFTRFWPHTYVRTYQYAARVMKKYSWHRIAKWRCDAIPITRVADNRRCRHRRIAGTSIAASSHRRLILLSYESYVRMRVTQYIIISLRNKSTVRHKNIRHDAE